MLKTVLIYIGCVLVSAFLTSIVSSQPVIADIQSFGIVVSFADRLSMTTKDLFGLGPVLLLLIGTSFLVAFIIANYAHQFIGGNRTFWYTAAGFCSFPATLLIMKYFMGVTVLASARTPLGLILVACCCLFGGTLYAVMTTKVKSKNYDYK